MGPATHYKRERMMEITDPCVLPGVIKCGHTDSEFVNVLFSEADYLQHGERYYICIHAEEKNSAFEKWTAELAEVNECSNGITVDLTAPARGTVMVSNLIQENYQISRTEVALSWYGFDDVEEMQSTTHPSGVSHFEVALGSVHGGEDVVKFSNVGYTEHVILHGLQLQNGHTYYASVKATDFVGKTTTAVSGGFIVDTSPPRLSGRQLQLAQQYITSTNVHVCWNNVFVDTESGMGRYSVGVGRKAGFDDVSLYTSTEDTCADLAIHKILQEGEQLFVTVKGYNKASLYTMQTSNPLMFVTSPPSSGMVYDGLVGDAGDLNKDKDYITAMSRMGAHWEGFHDPHSAIAVFRIKVGTCPGCHDVIQEFEYGTRTDIAYEHTTFSVGVKYFTSVTACNTAGMCTTAISDGVLIDISPPVPGSVSDGDGDRDVQFQASRKFVSAKWHGFSDAESGLHHYEWRVGTTPGADDIITSTHTALEEIVYRTLPEHKQLSNGQKIFSTVRAYNKAGLFSEKTSNGVLIDDTSPEVVSPPSPLKEASLLESTSVSRTVLGVSWLFSDKESYIERQFISIGSHVLGEFKTPLLEVPGFVHEYTFTNLDLHDGSKYRVKVIACNMAGLCTTSLTQDILVDSSKPQTGAFAIRTDRAHQLTRHEPGWMTYTDTTVKLAWLGFSDLHSGIDHYIVSLGSQPFMSDYNKGGVSVKLDHVTTGVTKGDEGVVQTFTIPVENLSPEGSITVTIWAVNGVGLKSDAYTRELYMHGDGILALRRDCSSGATCEGQCVCAPQGGKCATAKQCKPLVDGGDNTRIVVRDVIDLQFKSSEPDTDFSPFDTVMAASWSISTSSGFPIHRYEYSIGECKGDLPQGVFNAATEQVWFYAGVQTSAVVSVPRGKKLSPGLRYCFFVKAWYEERGVDLYDIGSTYSIFKSDGVTIDTLHPTTSQKLSISVKELKTSTGSKDIDYLDQAEVILINWSKKFIEGQIGISKYLVFISTSPGGHSIHESGEVTDVQYSASGLSLETDTVYYTGVLAYNSAKLVSWAYSDGVQVDLQSPVAGHVHDGRDIKDKNYQSSPTVVSASWFGFSDLDSALVKYYWCVGSSDDNTDCTILQWINVGLHTSYEKVLNRSLTSGATVWSKVYAVDAVGHRSDVVVSDGVTIDTSPPEPQGLAYLGDNLIRNPSFEVDEATIRAECSSVYPTAWQSNNKSCIKLVTPRSSSSKDGNMHVSVLGDIEQTVDNIEPGRQYRLSLHVGYPETINNHHQPIEILVTVGRERFTAKLDPDMCKGTCQVGDHSVILWTKQTFRFTATENRIIVRISSFSARMEFVLDHVTLESVDYMLGPDTVDTNDHMAVHTVFLPHWSSIHASWHFEDKESPITSYKWAIGTVPGGTQLQNYTNVGGNTQGTSTGLTLAHNTLVYISVMATNAAGLTSVSHSFPITVDLTPPAFDHVYDGPAMDDDYQSSTVVSVSWKAEDPETGIDYCAWALGTISGKDDISPFRRIPSGELLASQDIKDHLTANVSVTVFSTVLCVNNAGHVSLMSSDGVEISQESRRARVPGFGVLEEKLSVFSERGKCHGRSDRIRLHWDMTSGQYKYVVVGIEGETIVHQYGIPAQPVYTTAALSGFLLKNLSSHEVITFPVDMREHEGEITKLNVTVHGQPPTIDASRKMSSKRNNSDVVLSWEGIFSSPWREVDYEIQIGTVPGATDVVERILTRKQELKLTLHSTHQDIKYLFVTVAAIDQCGLIAYNSQQITII